MHESVHAFVQQNVKKDIIEGKDVIELGSLNINGSVRNYILSLKPKSYVGVDYQKGNGVDVVHDIHNIFDIYKEEQFDVVIATEMMEHIEQWKVVINNIKKLVKMGGYIIITTRSKGFPLHGYPYDYWRYEISDMQKIFSDFEGQVERDPQVDGVFVIAQKTTKEYVDLTDIKLYNINSNNYE